MKNDIIQPRILKGTRDFLGQDMWQRRYILSVITQVIESFGFEPLETPALEFVDILEGKYDEGEKLLYRLTDEGGRKLALKYDLTVPTARVVAMYPDLRLPYRRYQNQPVWRADKPQKGRYREFLQFDFDTFGSPSMLYDAEIICTIYEVFKKLGFPQFTILINNRKLLNGLVSYSKFETTSTMSVLRAVDKYQKIGPAAVKEELKGAGFQETSIAKLLDAIELSSSSTTEQILSKMKKAMSDYPIGYEGVCELEELFNALEDYGVHANNLRLDLTLARGLEYYTGPIHEVIIEQPKIGSLCGGGRYDELVGMFCGRDVPATGTSLGIERIVDVMNVLGMAPNIKSRLSVLITCDKAHINNSIELSRSLRGQEIPNEVYFIGAEQNIDLRYQLKYADEKGVPFAVIWPREKDGLGPEKIIVRDMGARSQEIVAITDLSQYIKNNMPQTSIQISAPKFININLEDEVRSQTTPKYEPEEESTMDVKSNQEQSVPQVKKETTMNDRKSKETDLGIRIGTVLSTEKVKGTDRLHIIVIDLGTEKRQIASGVPGDYEPGYLIGKQIPIKIDVEPVRIRGIESTARFLTTDDGQGGTVLIFPERTVPDGSHIW